MKINSISNQQYNYSRNKANLNMDNAPSFKAGGELNKVQKGIVGAYDKLAQTKPFQKFAGKLAKSDRSFTYLMVAESVILSTFYAINSLRNKKIEKEQKPQMVINDALVLGVSATGSLLLDSKVNKVVDSLSDKYFKKPEIQDFYRNLGKKAQDALGAEAPKSKLLETVAQGADDAAKMVGEHLKGIVGKTGELKPFEISADKLKTIQTNVKNAINSNSGNIEKAKEAVKGCVDDAYDALAARKEIKDIIPGINKLKTIVIFGLIYRYIGPVIVTPLANKLSSKFFNNKGKKEEKAEQTQQKK
ncbi:hypothetical protein IJD15_05350 [bacterium]|nr:hypothetical protein [bacterium]